MPERFASARVAAADLGEMARRGGKYWRAWAWFKWLDHRFRTASAVELRSAQLDKIRGIVAHAADNAPFYGELYAEAGVDPRSMRSLADFERLPIVTKDHVRRNFPDRIVVRGHGAHRTDFGRSSGTTGESVPFVRQASWKKNHYYGLLQHSPSLLSPITGELQTPQCSATTCSIRERRATLEDRLRRVLLRTRLNSYVYLPSSTDIFRESDAYFEELLGLLKDNGAELLFGASNYVGQLARWMIAHRRTLPLRAVVSTNELLLASVKHEIQRAFIGPVYNHYGSSEVQGLADECEHGSWHLRVDTNHLEIVRDDRSSGAKGSSQTQACAPGEVGRVLLTDLDNYWMPLIRYDVGDLAAMAEGPCACGRNNDALVRIEGRSADAWLDAQGGLVAPAAVGRVAHAAGISGRYRLVQETRGAVSLHWVDAPPDARAFESALADGLREILGAAQVIDLKRARAIAPERSNKYRLIYSKVPRGEAA